MTVKNQGLTVVQKKNRKKGENTVRGSYFGIGVCDVAVCFFLLTQCSNMQDFMRYLNRMLCNKQQQQLP